MPVFSIMMCAIVNLCLFVSLSVTLVRSVSMPGRIRRGIGDTVFLTEGEAWSP